MKLLLNNLFFRDAANVQFGTFPNHKLNTIINKQEIWTDRAMLFSMGATPLTQQSSFTRTNVDMQVLWYVYPIMSV